MNRSFYQFNEVIDLSSVLLYPQGQNLRGVWGGDSPPQLPISQGTEEVCRAKLLSV